MNDSLCSTPLQICNVLESLDVFLAEVEPSVDSVTGSEDDWEQIRQIISVFNKVHTYLSAHVRVAVSMAIGL